MRLRDTLNRVRNWLRGSRRRQFGAVGVGVGALAAAIGLPLYFAVLAGGGGGAERAQSIPTPSPVVSRPTPTPEPTPEPTPTSTPLPVFSVESGPLSEEAPTEGTFLIDLATERWLRVLPSYLDSFGAISPDGNTIVYQQADGLVALDANASDLRQLGEGHSAAFSPDGRVLALWGFEGVPPVTLIPWPDGQPVGADMPGPVNSAAWSATTLAASTPDGIYFITADGTAQRATDQAVRGFAWASHRSLLAFWTSDEEDGSILSTVAPGEKPQFLAQLPGERVHRVSWSSDGSLLAVGFTRPPPPSPDPGFDLLDIRVIDVASGHTQFTITGAGNLTMAWSPVESLLLFDGNSCSFEGWQLMLVNGDGSDLRPLSEARNGSHLGHAWSPDGREVATAWVERNAVTAVDVESGETRTLIRGPELILNVQWVTADRLLVTTIRGVGVCEGSAPQETRVVFP